MRIIDADKLIKDLEDVDDPIVRGCIAIIELQPTVFPWEISHMPSDEEVEV